MACAYSPAGIGAKQAYRDIWPYAAAAALSPRSPFRGTCLYSTPAPISLALHQPPSPHRLAQAERGLRIPNGLVLTTHFWTAAETIGSSLPCKRSMAAPSSLRHLAQSMPLAIPMPGPARATALARVVKQAAGPSIQLRTRSPAVTSQSRNVVRSGPRKAPVSRTTEAQIPILPVGRARPGRQLRRRAQGHGSWQRCSFWAIARGHLRTSSVRQLEPPTLIFPGVRPEFAAKMPHGSLLRTCRMLNSVQSNLGKGALLGWACEAWGGHAAISHPWARVTLRHRPGRLRMRMICKFQCIQVSVKWVVDLSGGDKLARTVFLAVYS
uniref:Uncharacterized protein n=1 Tax=Spironucleus salmonicida TaxID=348837 RepID=V6LLP1_9EUKA|eukprot:EST45625.1 Hypothetical protein SS50377_14482 [Spironucleus salmonicida]